MRGRATLVGIGGLIGLVAVLISGCVGMRASSRAEIALDPATGMEFVLVPGGCFQMGDRWGKGEMSERPVHEVCVDAFYLGRFEVTQGQWRAVMGENPSFFQQEDEYPVEQISWNDAQAFLSKLNASAEKNYRLPTEAEWEYACRSGGKEEMFCGGDELSALAWFDRTGGGNTQPVGQRQPNGLGLYDMSGNVWEFCSDRYDANYYGVSPEKNPQGPAEGRYFVKRGGSWSIGPRFLRATVRGRSDAADRHYSTGFRVALPIGP